MTLEPSYLLLFANYYIMLCTYNRPYLLATIILMWIGSRIRLTARQPYASPPGYQSPASGDNVPDPGSQDTTGAQPHHGSAPPSASHNNDILVNSTPYPLHSCARQEVSNANSVSHLRLCRRTARFCTLSTPPLLWPCFGCSTV